MDSSHYITNYEDYNSQVLNKKVVAKPVYQNPVVKISNVLSNEMGVELKRSEKLASIIYKNAQTYNIDPRIMIAIIKVESNFNQKSHNTVSCKKTKAKICGDFSLAQINYETWSKAFPRLGRRSLEINQLKTDEAYAINRMAEILSILKDENDRDPLWFSRYHSKTPVHKKRYTLALKAQIKKLSALAPHNMPRNYLASAK